MRRSGWIALAASFCVLAAACTGGGGKQATPPSAKRGGSAVFGAERWPQCLNPITSSCGLDNGAWWVVLNHVLPRAMEVNLDGDFAATPLITMAPSLQNGLLIRDPFTVTYRINPNAMWDDGTPITSADFDFTWKAVLNTTDALTEGYSSIDSIDASNPQTAVIRFKAIFVKWPELFGGSYGGLLEKAAFPAADPDKPNLKDEMVDTIPFSGGPWKLESFDPSEAVLARNDRYWASGKRPLLDKVTFVPVTDIDAQVNALLRGEVDAIALGPNENVGLDALLKGTNVKGVGGDTPYLVALWFNLSRPPMNDIKVREALMYGVDRQAIVDDVVKIKNPDAKVRNCGFVSFPNVGPWCDREYFGQFTYDPQKAIRILEADGYDCARVPDEACTKGGKALVIGLSTISSNPGFLSAAALIERSAQSAGIDIRIKKYEDPGVLFGVDGPQGRFDTAVWASGGSIDPSVTLTFACDQFPTEANEFSGGNWNRWCEPQADQLMKQTDGELDLQTRLQLFQRIYELEVQHLISLPLYAFPTVSGWRTDRIAGPVGRYNSHPTYGFFFNMNEWHVP